MKKIKTVENTPLKLTVEQIDYLQSLQNAVEKGKQAEGGIKSFLDWFRSTHDLPEKYNIDMRTGLVEVTNEPVSPNGKVG